MQIWIAFLLLAGVSAATTNPRFSDLVVHESIVRVPDGFTRVSSAPVNQSLNLRIALANSNMDGLLEAFYAVSDPSNPLYGQHLSKEEVRFCAKNHY